VKFAGYDIADISTLPLKSLASLLAPYAVRGFGKPGKTSAHPEKIMVTQRIAKDLTARLAVLLDLGLGYLSLERSTPTLSPGEMQRLRLGTQLHSSKQATRSSLWNMSWTSSDAPIG